MKDALPWLVAIALLGSSVAQAEDLHFTLHNRSHTALVALQVSTVASDSWEENLIAGDTLAPGDDMEVVIADGERTCRYDILMTFSDESTIEDREVNLCELGSYTAED